MKKLYIEPIINTVEFNAENILTASGERVDMAKTVLAEYENIEVLGSDGLLVDIFKGEQIILLTVVHDNNVELVADLRCASCDIFMPSCKGIETTRK